MNLTIFKIRGLFIFLYVFPSCSFIGSKDIYLKSTLNWENHQTYIPSLSTVNNSPYNRFLGYFITTFVLLCCGIGHLVVRKVVEIIFLPSRKIDFVDLLSVSNISVFILDNSLHGYYIHGQSPSGKADINVDELLRSLEEEGQGKVRNRG